MNFFSATIFRVLTLLVSFLITIQLARALAIEDYHEYNALVVYIGIAFCFCTYGINNYLPAFMRAMDNVDAIFLIRKYVCLLFVNIFLVGVISYFFVSQWELLLLFVFFVSLNFFLSELYKYSGSILSSTLISNGSPNVGMTSSGFISNIALFLYLVLFDDIDYVDVLVYSIFIQFLIFTLYCYILDFSILKKLRMSYGDIFKFYKDAFPYFFLVFAFVLQSSLELWFIIEHSNTAISGQYVLAYRVSTFVLTIHSLLAGFSMVYYSKASRSKLNEEVRDIRAMFLITNASSILSFLVVSLPFSEVFFASVFGGEMLPALDIIRVKVGFIVVYTLFGFSVSRCIVFGYANFVSIVFIAVSLLTLFVSYFIYIMSEEIHTLFYATTWTISLVIVNVLCFFKVRRIEKEMSC